jgi:hypothetical protein
MSAMTTETLEVAWANAWIYGGLVCRISVCGFLDAKLALWRFSSCEPGLAEIEKLIQSGPMRTGRTNQPQGCFRLS